MKTIVTAAALLMLWAPAWADEPSNANDAANTNEPSLLSEGEKDGVTAAGEASVGLFDAGGFFLDTDLNDTSSRSSRVEFHITKQDMTKIK